MSTHPLTSIVILTRNQLDYTRQCVDGILRNTPEPIELVFVDNGSTDGTLDYLRSIDGAVVIDNDENLGFGGGCNVGIAASSGERILLLNNDVVPTPGWLAAMHDALDSDDAIGLVGPRSNSISGIQCVPSVGYDQDTLDGMDAWAEEWCRERRGMRTRTPRLIGFCILMGRDVVERIGGFDLRYELGNFEDDDFSLRAGLAGFACAVAEDSFLHHYGSRTFAGERIDYAASMSRNFIRFAEAWHIDTSKGAAGYDPKAVLAANEFDPVQHWAPLVGEDLSDSRIDVGPVRSHLVGVCCDRLDAQSTELMLDHALSTWGPDDDVTIVVRIDPRDSHSGAVLDAVADRHEAGGLPDVVVVEASEHDDRLVLREVDEVVVAGPAAWSRRLLSIHVGATVVREAERSNVS